MDDDALAPCGRSRRTRMLSRAAFPILSAIAIIACSPFSSDDGTSNPSTPPADGGTTDGPGVIPGSPGDLTITFAGPVRVMQGGSVKAHVKIARENIDGRITVTASKLPSGIGVKELVLESGIGEGDLEITAAANAKQGPVAGAILTASTTAGQTAKTPLPVFVRGSVGALDTTYATDGTLDLGAAQYAAAARSAKYVHIAHETTLRRLALDGTPDAGFAPVTLARATDVIAVAADDSVYTFESPSVVRRSSAGAVDVTYGTNGVSDAIRNISSNVNAMVVTPAFEVVHFGSLKTGPTTSTSRAGRLTAAGAVAADFNYPGYYPTGSAGGSGGAMIRQPDGSFMGFVGSTNGIVTAVHINSSGGIDDTHDAQVSTSGGAGARGAVRTSTAIFVLVDSGDGRGVIRLGPDGTHDTSFGNGGVARMLPSPPSDIQIGGMGLDVDSQGRAVAVAFTKLAGVEQIAISRSLPSGKPDTALSPTGFITFPAAVSDYLFVFATEDERILLMGLRGTNAFVQRYWM